MPTSVFEFKLVGASLYIKISSTLLEASALVLKNVTAADGESLFVTERVKLLSCHLRIVRVSPIGEWNDCLQNPVVIVKLVLCIRVSDISPLCKHKAHMLEDVEMQLFESVVSSDPEKAWDH